MNPSTKDTQELAMLGLKKLDNRFRNKIDPEEYYLAYSGGTDSHLLLWYIKTRNLPIKIVSVNTRREHIEIKDRMYAYADTVLYPAKSFEEIISEYGIPCFSKQQDEFIERYQNGSRSDNTMNAIFPKKRSKFQLNLKARRLLLNDLLPKVSNKCCKWTKKEPMKQYEQETGLKPIVGIRSAESATREATSHSCLTKKGKFSPLYDIPDQVVNAMYEYFKIDKPKIYDYIDRTGCIGCPYGKRNTYVELSLVTDAQRRYAIKSFSASYDILGIEYKSQQMKLF